MTDARETESCTVKKAAGKRARIEIAIDNLSEHNFWADLALAIERGGVFVATYQVLELGTMVDLVVTLPDSVEPVSVDGVVRWTRPHLEDSDGSAGFGVKFLELTSDTQERLERFVKVRQPLVFELDDAPMRRHPTAA